MHLKHDILDDDELMQDMPSLIKQIIFALLTSQPKTDELLAKLGPHLSDINSLSGLSEVKNLYQTSQKTLPNFKLPRFKDDSLLIYLI